MAWDRWRRPFHGADTAAAGCVLLNGGTGGVMEAANREVVIAGGLTVGFLAVGRLRARQPYVQIALPTGLGTLRNVLTARCSDAVSMIGGGVGTLNELTGAYDSATPVVAVRGTGGWADRLDDTLIDGQWLDERRVVAIAFADTATESVAIALQQHGRVLVVVDQPASMSRATSMPPDLRTVGPVGLEPTLART